MTAINNFLLNLAVRKCSKIVSENIELKKHLMQCIKMLNPLILMLINLTAKSKGLWWRTGYLFLFLLTSHQGPIIINREGGRTLEDHMVFRGKGGGISRRRQSLRGGGDCRN